MICVTADTTKFKESLANASSLVHEWDRKMRTHTLPAGYQMHRLPPDWESRLWSLTHDLAVRMADRCQEGLTTPEEFGKLAHNMAAWTVNTAIEALKPKPPTPEEIKKMFEKFQFQVQVKEPQK